MAARYENVESCGVCRKIVHNFGRALMCSYCSHWTHICCTTLSDADCLSIQSDDHGWMCLQCVEQLFPFASIMDEVEYFSSLFAYANGFRVAGGQFINNVAQLNLITSDLKFDKDIDPDRHCSNVFHKSNYVFEESLNSIAIEDRYAGNFSVLHINARSLLKHYDEICDLIARLNFKFSAIVITETWTDASNEHLVDIVGYSKVIKHREGRKGGGVAIYVDSNLKCQPDVVLNQFDSSDFESVFVNVTSSPGKSVLIGAIYRPPGGDINRFNDSMDALLAQLKKCRTRLFLAGDYNINLLNHTHHSETDNFLNLMYDNRYYPLISNPTRFSATGSTLIDNIFTNCLESDYHAGVLINDISDHLPVFYITHNANLRDKKDTKRIITKRLIDEVRIMDFLQKLNGVHWNIVDGDANACFDAFFSKFMSLYNVCFPIITERVRPFRANSKPWFTRGLYQSVQKKARLYRKWLCSRSDSDLSKYKKYKNKLTSLLRSSEKNYYCKRFIEIQGDIAKTWKLIKSVLPRTSKNDSICEINVDACLVSDPGIISNKFNQFFTGIGSTLAKKIPNIDGTHREFLSSAICKLSNSLFLCPSTPSEIVNVVSTFKGNKAAGFDSVSPNVVKQVIESIAVPLSLAINASFNQGVFPDRLKTAKVVPIFKSEDRAFVNNYRPVSVLSVFSKIYERLMYNRLNSYLVKNSLLTENQFGFKAQHSTSMAVLQLVDQIATQLDNGNLTVGVFIDLSKAFDTVDHSILLDKLSMYGVRGNSFDWIQSYLSGRHQYVQLNEVKSDLLHVNCGVPQGSILGPLLFIIYINDIVNISNILQMILFADDTNLFLSGPNVNDICTRLNAELCKLSRWFKLNKLSLNIKKTNFIVFRPKNKIIANVPKIQIDSNSLDMVESSKFLGIIINSRLDWSDHIGFIKNKVCKTIGILKCVRHKLPSQIMRSLYFSLVNPYYEYGNIVWAVNNSVSLQKLFITQKKAIRIISNAKWREHTHPIFRSLHILKIDEIHKLQVACFMFRVCKGFVPSYFSSIFCFNADVHHYNTRHASDYHITVHRTTLLKYTIRIAGPLIWNSIDYNIRSSNNISSFRSRLKRLLLS